MMCIFFLLLLLLVFFLSSVCFFFKREEFFVGLVWQKISLQKKNIIVCRPKEEEVFVLHSFLLLHDEKLL